MPRNRLSQFGASNRVVRIQPDATAGAQFGANLYDEEGNLVTMASLLASIGAQPSSQPSSGDLTTDNVAEGGNLYFTDPRVYAAVKAQLKPGSNITITVDDEAMTLTVAASTSGGSSLPMVTGEVGAGQPVFVYFDDGSLLYAEAA